MSGGSGPAPARAAGLPEEGGPATGALGTLLRGAAGVAGAAFAAALLLPGARAAAGAAGTAVLLGAPFAVTLLAAGVYGRAGRWRVAGLAALLLLELAAGAWLAA